MDQALRKTSKNEQFAITDLLQGLLKKRMDQLQYSGTSDIEKNLTIFQQMFDLNELEKEICLFLFILSTYEEAQSLFQYHLKCDHFAGRNHLATCLGSNSPAIGEALNGKLSKVGIVEPDRGRSISMDSGFVNLLQNASGADIKTEFFHKIDPDPVPLDAHPVEPQVMEHILHLLTATPLSSTHVIFYGPPGTGKTSLAYGLGKKLGLPIYLVEHGGKEKSWKRQAAFAACVNVASQGEGALIIADDATKTVYGWNFNAGHHCDTSRALNFNNQYSSLEFLRGAAQKIDGKFVFVASDFFKSFKGRLLGEDRKFLTALFAKDWSWIDQYILVTDRLQILKEKFGV